VNGGLLQVNGGTLQCGNNGSAALEISGGTVELLGGETNVRTVTRPAGSGTLRFKGGVLRPRADSATFVSGLTAAEVGTGGAKIELDGWFVTIPQPLVHDPGLGGTADDGLLVKDSFGNGRLTLTGASTYTGATIIESGTLRLGAGGSIAASPVIEVQEMGTLDGQTGTTIASGQTVRGTGTMVGTVTIGAGATLSPGVAGLGAMKGDILILQGQTVMEVNKSGGMITNDSVMNLWQLTYGGTLTVTKTGEAFALGDTVELFASANYAGSFATVSLPDLPTGLFWETTGLLINGSIEVVDTLPSPNFSLTSGTYVGAQTVSITGVDGSTIRYTTDGSDPLTSGTVLSGVSPVTGIVLPLNGVPVTLRAYATLSGFTDSAVVTAVYTLLENPTWSFLGSGNWSDAAKWYGGVIANGSGVIADFSTLTLTSSNSVNLDGPRTVGGLKFGDVGNQRTWALAGSALTLAGPTQPIIHVVNQTLTSNVALLGTQGFVKTGAGTFQINGDQSISGPVVVQGGQLILSGGNSSGGAIGGASSISVTNTTVLSTGDNALIGWGAKTLPITLGVGSVLTGNGGSATNIQELTLAGGELGSASSTHPTYGSWNLNKNISVTENSIISALNVQFTLATPSISVAAGKTLTASGFFENSAKTSVRPLTKTGAGTMLMTGANSYTGATNINEGVLQLNGSLAAASVVTVAGGATFAGSGTAGTVTVNAGAVIAPGASQIGNLTTSTQSLAGTYQCQLSGSQSDQLVVNGNVTLTGASLTISAINPPTACSYTILTYSGTRTGSFASVPSGYSLNYDTPNQVNLIVPMSGYASWVASYGLAGNAALADADPDFDGITNGIEFVLGGNPATVQDQSLLPTMTLVTNPGGTVPNGSYVRFSYRRTAASLSVNPRVEFDADLAGPWTNATGSTGVVQEVVSDFYASPTMADRVDVFIPRALYEVQGKLFCRLVVTVP
jgi:autotransporter-associated beta strand protein